MKKIIKLTTILPIFLFATSNAAIMNDFLKEQDKKILVENEKKVSKKVECSVYEKLNLETQKKLLELESKKEK